MATAGAARACGPRRGRGASTPDGGRSGPTTSWRSWPSTTAAPSRARRARCCGARACTPRSSPTGAGRTEARSEPDRSRDGRSCPPRALSADERDRIIEVLDSERFCDLAPAQVWATLLDEGTYLCSVAVMYRLLRARAEVRERRRVA